MSKSSRLTLALPIAVTVALGSTWLLRAEDPKPEVLFDEGHGQRFTIDGIGPLHLSSLAGIVREQGAEVRSTRESLTSEALAEIDALVVSGAFEPITDSEIAAIRDFLDRGGRLAVMLHIGPPVAALLHQLGVSISNGVIQEQEAVLDQAIDFRVTRLEPHAVTEGLDSFTVYGCWALLPMTDTTLSLAQTSASAWVDLNRNQRLDEADAEQTFSVLVAGAFGEGQFLVFGDDAIFQNRFLVDDNRRLAINLARWLAGGDPPVPSELAP